MALDVGEKRIGVAVSDPLGMTAQGVKTIHHQGAAQALEEIDKILTEYEAKRVVVGLPLSMDGGESAQTERIHRFEAKLSKRFKKRATIVMWDERLSTMAAERTLLEADVSRAKRKQVIDKMAAVILLQNYLDAGKPLIEADS